MLIDHLLFPLGGDEHHKGVESADRPPQLETIDQKCGDMKFIPVCAGEKEVLQVDFLLHKMHSFFLSGGWEASVPPP